MKLTHTKDYLLWIEEVSGFKIGDWNYEIDNTIPIYQFDYTIEEYPGNKIIAYRKLNENAKELNLPELPPFEENIEIMWLDFNKNHNRNSPLSKEQFVRAINYKATQSRGTYSLEDMIEAFNAGYDLNTWEQLGIPNEERDYLNEHEFIQSLSTKKIPKEFILSNKFNTFEENLKNGEYKW